MQRLDAPPTGNKITYDVDVKGFGCRVTASGASAFVVNYQAAGRERRITIGSFPDWSTAAARDRARRLKRQIDMGGDRWRSEITPAPPEEIARLAAGARRFLLPA